MLRRRTTLATFLLAAFLFLLSGALGLGYQLIWIRKATLLVGSSQIAYATTVASFFLGLALGSAVVGRYLRSKRRSPLFVYGLFEAAIGLFALVFPELFALAETGYNALYPSLQGSVLALFAVRFTLLLTLFVVPTFFMGGTLPLLLDGLVARDAAIGPSTSLLYGINIVGAVLGVLATSYFAIPELGMGGTSRVAGVGNLAIATVALLAFRKVAPLHVEKAGPAGDPLFAVASFLSGFAAIAYQIGWVRYFDLVTEAEVYRTAMILAVYLSGLAVGSMGLGPILSRGIHPLRVLAISQPLIPCILIACLGLSGLAEITYGDEALTRSYEVAPSWSLLSERTDAIFLVPLARVALVFFAPVVLIGIGLPAIIAAATHRSAELRASSGRLLFWNTIGCSAGGFAAGYVLIPAFGLMGVFVTSALVSVAIAVWADRGRPARVAGLGLVLPAIALVALFMFARTDPVRSAVWRQWWDLRTPEDRIVEIVEGPLNTTFVFEGPRTRVIGSNHVVLGVVPHGEPSTQAIQGHLPALFYGKPGHPERVLGIALGTGQTFGALLLHPVQQVDVVDISPEMVELSLRHFADYNHGLGTDDRVTIHLDDGRHFIDRAPADFYDVVTLEPPPPTDEGVYVLYSLEFYESVERVLREGGVVTQWLPLYLITPSEALGIVKTQAAVFPHTFVLTAGLGDFIVLSVKGDSPPRYELDWIRERVSIFERERHIAGFRVPGTQYPVASLEGVLSLVVMGPTDVADLAGAVYVDDTLGLSYPGSDGVLRRRHRRALGHATLAALPHTSFAELQRYFVEPIPAERLDAQRANFVGSWRAVVLPEELEAAEARFRESEDPDDRVDAALTIAEAYGRALLKAEALAWVERAIEADPGADSEQAMERVRGVARQGIDLDDGVLRRWLATLPESSRSAPIALTVSEELERHDAWVTRHRTYLLE